MRTLFIVILTVLGMASHAQNQGIEFFHGTWAEAVDKAKTENKLIFVDFYTQWCGPCYNMAKNVFTLPDVGQFYNTHFLNVKIDAENGEGIALAQKYAVRSYPTYAFIDPATEEVVHRSSSRQTGEQFIATGRGALTPQQRSFYLDEQYRNGNRAQAFLKDYISYKSTVYARQDVLNAFEELLKQTSLMEKEVWDLYVASISGPNVYTRQISDHYDEFCSKLGKDVVDAKLRRDTQYGDLEFIESLCDYEGKAFNCEMIRINSLLNKDDYDAAIVRIDSLIADSRTDQQELIARLKYIARVNYRRDSYPVTWFLKCIEYLQYVTYNQKERDDAALHQEYAATLELLIRKMAAGDCKAPDCLITQPAHGKPTYSMRPDDLKMKPKRGQK
ncbi:MAG: thioredoxin family protein [Bacteroides sp.]|nr:thioredoxin family protein [Bacteroides sp.]